MVIGCWNKKSKNKGFTLVEILVSISLLSLVLLMTYNMHLFNYKVFNKGSSKADIQSNLRLNADFISDQIRYASNIKILTNKPTTFDPLKQYIYSEGGVLKFYDVGTIEDVAGNLGGVSSTIYFNAKDSQTVTFKVTGTQKDESYEIASSVYMLNLGTGGIAESNGAAIEFRPGMPVNANINAKPVQTITISPIPSGTNSIAKNNSIDFTAIITPTDASINTVKWSVEVIGGDPSTASIISTGASTGILRLSAATIGSTIKVSGTSLDGTNIHSEYSLNVIDDPFDLPTSIVVKSSIPDNPSPDYIFETNGSLQMSSYILPNTANKSVVWSVNNASAATIDAAGMLRSKSTNTYLGDIIVTATSISAPSLKDTKTIKIIPNINHDSDINLDVNYIDGDNFDVSCYVGTINASNIASLSKGVKKIKYNFSKKDDEYIDVNTNPFTVAIVSGDKIYIKFSLLSGDDIIKIYKRPNNL